MNVVTIARETGLDVPRKNAGYRLDDRCINALKVLAERTGVSVNEYLENLLFEHAKVQRVIAPEEQRLGETRGRKKETTDRSGAGRKPKADQQDETEEG